MTQKFYTRWQAATLADAGCSVSQEYRRFQTALIHELTRYATASGAKVVSSLKGHYDTSCFIERNGRFVYISLSFIHILPNGQRRENRAGQLSDTHSFTCQRLHRRQ